MAIAAIIAIYPSWGISAVPYIVFIILAAFQIFGTKKLKTVHLVLKIVILVFSGLMCLLNLVHVPQNSWYLLDVVFWAISFVAFILEPPIKPKAEKKEEKAAQKKSRLFIWLISLRHLWLVTWAVSLFIFTTTFILILLKVGSLNGMVGALLINISSLVFLISLSIWLIVKFGKKAIIPATVLMMLLIAESYFIGKDIVTHQFSLTYNSNPSPTPVTSANWKEFVSTSGSFKFMYPENYNFTKNSTTTGNPGVSYNALSPQLNSSRMSVAVYKVIVGTFPKSDNPPTTMIIMPNFIDLVNPLDATTSGKIISYNLSNFGKYKAFDMVSNVQGEYWIEKYVAVNQTLYLVGAYYASESDYNEDNYNKFINSFVILSE